MPILETERLALRQLSPADAPFILDLLNQPSFLRFIGDRKVRTLADAENYIRNGPVKSYARFGFGLWLVELKDTPVPVGICGLIKRDELPDVDVGYAFLPQFWGKGYASEAASAAVAYGRNVVRLERILAIVAPDNERSIKVLERIGLHYERDIVWPADGANLKVYALAGQAAPGTQPGPARKP